MSKTTLPSTVTHRERFVAEFTCEYVGRPIGRRTLAEWLRTKLPGGYRLLSTAGDPTGLDPAEPRQVRDVHIAPALPIEAGFWGSGVAVTLGDGADSDTVQTLFGHLADANYCVRFKFTDGGEVDGVVVSVTATADDDDDRLAVRFECLDSSGRESGYFDLRPWDEVAALHVY